MTSLSRASTWRSARRAAPALVLLSALAGCASEPVCDAGEGAAAGALAPLAGGASTGDPGGLVLGVLLVPLGAAVGAIVGAVSDCPATTAPQADSAQEPAVAVDADRSAEIESECAWAAASARRRSCGDGLGTPECRTALARVDESCEAARQTIAQEGPDVPPAAP